MSNSTITIGIILIILAGISTIPIGRLIFKKSIIFKVFVTLIIPIDAVAILAFFVGAKGIIHLTWAVPLALVFIFVGYYLVSDMLRKPLNEMREKASSLSEGDLDISFDEKYQKGRTEIAQVMRMLVKLTNSLKNIAGFANHIGRGELNAEYHVLGEKDSLGKSMLNMRQNLQEAEKEKEKRQQEDERRNWVTIGLAKFAELLRANNDNIEELCHNIISNMVKYIGANQAGIFILNDDNSNHLVLEMKACYAYERRKFLEKTIELGEGLVGTCFLERESIYMTSIPKDYIHITSGLGDGNPHALLVVPLKVNEEIYGVIEIASFKDFESHEKEFVEKVAESIASTISSVKINMQTGKLLEQSRLQSEEMASQEEELRQNMEEMQATQEEMRRRENEMVDALDKMKTLQQISDDKEYESQQLYRSVLNIFNAVEFSGEGILEAISPSVLQLLGNAPESAFIGKTFAETYPGGLQEGEMLWQKLLKGEQAASPSVNVNQISMKFECIPVFNKNGKLNRVIALLLTNNLSETDH